MTRKDKNRNKRIRRIAKVTLLRKKMQERRLQ